ncbi:MAG TPA: C40 family peptidase [Micromonosporaceae bacterium]|nr:C40 family peptidase [Micromonosporaceae bacterium]
MVAGVLVASIGAAAVAAPAPAADPVANISRDAEELEQVIEDYNHVSGLIDMDKTKAAKLGTQIKGLDKQVTAARAALRPDVRRVFEVGTVTTLQLVFDSTSTAALVDQMTTVRGIAYQQQSRIATLATARKKAAAAKKSLDATIVTLTKRKADLAAKKRTILADIAAQQDAARHLPPGERTDPSPLRPVACPYTKATGPAAVAVAVACSEIGKPYVWAAVGPKSFDCSGLVVYAWGKAGVKLRHFTGWQWHDATPITASQLQPGDLVFYFRTHHHVAIYVGGGWVVNAPHTGDVVRMARIDKWPISGYRRP